MAAKDGSQARTGHLQKDEPNRERRTGRSSGFGKLPQERKFESEESVNPAPKTGRKPGAQSVTGSSNLDVEEAINNPSKADGGEVTHLGAREIE